MLLPFQPLWICFRLVKIHNNVLFHGISVARFAPDLRAIASSGEARAHYGRLGVVTLDGLAAGCAW